ncbi:hypothetical protein ACJJJB_00060 (plasmid) [Microbulbifer sp. ANSA001]|uniref:hypothetical protein n=1 Tax=Microbulbifer sp. ANSA001 TaxID=3243358 RepID=UPI004041FE3D
MGGAVIIDKSKFERRLQRVARETPKVAVNALNWAAYNTREVLQREMGSIFDRPTPFTKRGMLVDRASADHLQARVYLNDWVVKGTSPADYLRPHIFGGTRKLKRWEKTLQMKGLLPQGMYAVPSKYAQLDRYGNFPRGLLNRIISQIGGFGEQGYLANAGDKNRKRRWRGTKKKRGERYFVLREASGKLPPGIYLQKNYGEDSSIAHLQMGAAKPVFIFVKQSPSYNVVFPFHKIAAQEALAQLPKTMRSALKRALKRR